MLSYCQIPHLVEAGCDEAGRGPLAGSVFCAAVILQGQAEWMERLNDSKQLSEKDREELRPLIEANTIWAVAEVTAEEIDRFNILNASIIGMQRALDIIHKKLPIEHVIVDGNKWKPWIPEDGLLAIPADTVVKGDGKYMSIAAASILAKTHRDEYMRKLAEKYPGYGWERNMGYPTREHYEALRNLGPTPVHRMTFNLKLS